MSHIFGFFSFVVSVYMMIVTVRILLTWFSGFGQSGLRDILGKITDPFLNWFRRFDFLRVGYLDLSPVAALGVLSLANNVFGILARYGRITIGIILAITVQTLWGAVSFFLGFLIIVLILAYISQRGNKSGRFWSVIDMIAQPVLFRVNRHVFRRRAMETGTAIILSAALLLVLNIVLGIIVNIASALLGKLPI